MYSQNAEEKWIVHALAGHLGRFLDIGAFDGVTFSNTRRLVELGWTGVLVEPSPSVLPSLRANVEGRPGLTVLPIAVGAWSGPVELFDAAGDAISTTRRDQCDRWRAYHVPWQSVRVQQYSATRLIEEVGDDFRFVSIDTEGQNLELVQAMPWGALKQCRLICVEHDGQPDRMLAQLQPLRYRELTRNPENILLIRD